MYTVCREQRRVVRRRGGHRRIARAVYAGVDQRGHPRTVTKPLLTWCYS